jgi:hypothetical protein
MERLHFGDKCSSKEFCFKIRIGLNICQSGFEIGWQHIHTRYNQCVHTFMSALCIAGTAVIWL